MISLRDESLRIEPGPPLGGELRVPGDKSISHRALLLGALADGTTQISGFLPGADCRATLAILRELGVTVHEISATELRIDGVGLHGLREPAHALDCGNSGTAIRLLAGVLAGQPFTSTLTGDASLCRRPMRRVIMPLCEMGAEFQAANGGCAPLTICGRRPLAAIEYAMPVASAQVKSAVLLAGLYAAGSTSITEPAPSRDHTERMLQQFGCPVLRSGDTLSLTGGCRLRGAAIRVPGDLSSAAFFLAAAAMRPGAALTLRDVGVNPTRAGILTILQQMGADIRLDNPRDWGGEPVADIHVRGGKLHGVAIPPAQVPLAIDEFPAILAAAAVAKGETLLSGAAELRHKESDRLAAMAEGLAALGIQAECLPDGMRVQGGQPQAGMVDSRGDHRIAMAFAMLAGQATGPVTIRDTANIATSFPGFAALAREAGLRVSAGPETL